MSSASLSDSEVPGRYFTRVRERAYGFLSIESVKVKINDKSKGPRQIYGEIKVDTHALGRCIYFYHRNGDEAEPVPAVDDDPDGFNLTLCGPNHCIDDDFRVIAVALYEDGPQPFFSGEFSLCHQMFGWGKSTMFGDKWINFRYIDGLTVSGGGGGTVQLSGWYNQISKSQPDNCR